ncbi:hypothetical protein AGDE_15692 [Angomonas deanei]|uniref:C3H1-type domain-containing protein n=1 Tax=Angomonas deanei TaxID=59799 RepID=A0A7G2CS27_9TRYP|nr:hypothetical protein AGDE_15692 [Angomonas deanei]CAD2222335.1 hypothetical protein, conserved [Angomonas deanei]|eukprot:EPY18625.1 hypothetical protein AGDE_15692 [Angomonas deanei]
MSSVDGDLHSLPSIHTNHHNNNDITEVFDPTFHYIYEVPTAAVTHLPPAKLNITRLVLCRSYHPSEPHRCLQQHLCKFVHVDCDLTTVPAQPIHVNYIYQRDSSCTYDRLPAGELLEVRLPNGGVNKSNNNSNYNNQHEDVFAHRSVLVPSERVLVTQGTAGTSSRHLMQRYRWRSVSASIIIACAAWGHAALPFTSPP